MLQETEWCYSVTDLRGVHLDQFHYVRPLNTSITGNTYSWLGFRIITLLFKLYTDQI